MPDDVHARPRSIVVAHPADVAKPRRENTLPYLLLSGIVNFIGGGLKLYSTQSIYWGTSFMKLSLSLGRSDIAGRTMKGLNGRLRPWLNRKRPILPLRIGSCSYISLTNEYLHVPCLCEEM